MGCGGITISIAIKPLQYRHVKCMLLEGILSSKGGEGFRLAGERSLSGRGWMSSHCENHTPQCNYCQSDMSTGSQKIVGLAVTASVQVSGLLKPTNTDVSLACFSSAATPFVNCHRLYGRANTVLTWEAKSMGNGEFCLPPQNRNLWINCNKIWQNWLVREGNP